LPVLCCCTSVDRGAHRVFDHDRRHGLIASRLERRLARVWRNCPPTSKVDDFASVPVRRSRGRWAGRSVSISASVGRIRPRSAGVVNPTDRWSPSTGVAVQGDVDRPAFRSHNPISKQKVPRPAGPPITHPRRPPRILCHPATATGDGRPTGTPSRRRRPRPTVPLRQTTSSHPPTSRWKWWRSRSDRPPHNRGSPSSQRKHRHDECVATPHASRVTVRPSSRPALKASRNHPAASVRRRMDQQSSKSGSGLRSVRIGRTANTVPATRASVPSLAPVERSAQ